MGKLITRKRMLAAGVAVGVATVVPSARSLTSRLPEPEAGRQPSVLRDRGMSS